MVPMRRNRIFMYALHTCGELVLYKHQAVYYRRLVVHVSLNFLLSLIVFSPHSDEEGVVVENGTFSWSKDGPPCLKRYNKTLKAVMLNESPNKVEFLLPPS